MSDYFFDLKKKSLIFGFPPLQILLFFFHSKKLKIICLGLGMCNAERPFMLLLFKNLAFSVCLHLRLRSNCSPNDKFAIYIVRKTDGKHSVFCSHWGMRSLEFIVSWEQK